MSSFGATNGQAQYEEDLDLQRALAESLREFNNTNDIVEKDDIQTLDENKKQRKDNYGVYINNSVTFNDLINYSKSVQNELVNILSLNSNNSKRKDDIDSLIQIITGEKVIANNKFYENVDETYDPSKDTELKLLPIERVNDIIEVIFGTNGSVFAQDEDIKRWIYHTIEFVCNYSVPTMKDEENDSKTNFLQGNKSIFTFKENFTSMNCCLIQQGGGPCGVLASLNGFIVSQLIFNPLRLEKIKEKHKEDLVEYLNSISYENCWEALIESICMIIFQSCPESKYRVIQYIPSERMEPLQQNEHFDFISNFLIGNGKNLYYYVDYDNIMDVYQFYWRRLKSGIFSNIGSLFSILVSVVGSRTPNQIRLDMDDSMTPLVGMFGHCSQELVNLFITGSAVSNVFDGVKILNDNCRGAETRDITESLSLKGINKKSILGYLTEHEALHYCKVGLNYKYPLYPIWIIVNKNHYKCSFSFNFTECILTVSQEFTQVMQKAFEKFDTENSGFIFDSQLEKFLSEINLRDYMLEAEKLSENGIILWNDLKKSILNFVGIENEEDNQLRGSRIGNYDSAMFQYKLWTSVYIFDGQIHSGKKLIISTIFPLENYSKIKNLYSEFSNHGHNGSDERKSIEELDLISILQTRWGRDTIIETKVLDL
ncbi:UIM domain and EF hand containing that also has a conserved domain between [Cryptosporidium sp. chipmunk genotype I]|uniref:UIM domain and EF hand containing that also has a conserved domain between n=1 Tax=Cryptosporidium sp. chipmunk genotype I TaxID=1280935 RepID=UPI00351A223F|nr:UIM domain and EF hand containing that also has a conserved domain between [Cryptosporidium sp. chipmunk genotype I]